MYYSVPTQYVAPTQYVLVAAPAGQYPQQPQTHQLPHVQHHQQIQQVQPQQMMQQTPHQMMVPTNHPQHFQQQQQPFYYVQTTTPMPQFQQQQQYPQQIPGPSYIIAPSSYPPFQKQLMQIQPPQSQPQPQPQQPQFDSLPCFLPFSQAQHRGSLQSGNHLSLSDIPRGLGQESIGSSPASSVIRPAVSPEEVLYSMMEQQIREKVGVGSMSFVVLQHSIKEIMPDVVETVLPHYDHSWHKFVQGVPNFIIFHYAAHEIARLELKGWADVHEARIRLATEPLAECHRTDQLKAKEYNTHVSNLLITLREIIDKQGPVEIADLTTLVSSVFPYFANISKSSLRRIIMKSATSTLWVTTNSVHRREDMPQTQN